MLYEDDVLDSAFDNDSHQNVSEPQIQIWKSLINLVQPNLLLYQKKHKEYSNKSMKIQLWNNIGASLIPPITGIDAEKMFYRLRQKFGKERRKVTQSQARSGAGADHVPYTSNWILYQDLMFLADHIQPRQTSSNFQPAILKRKKAIASQRSYFSSSQLDSLQLASSQLSRSQCATSTPAIICTPPITSEESTDVIWNIDSYESLDPEFLTENEKASVADSTESSSVSLSNSSTSQGIKSRSMQEVSAITPQKLTPPADNTKKRKRQTSDEVDAAMVKSSENISSLANTLEIALKKNITPVSEPTKPKLSAAVENILSGIALGLGKVHEDRQMDCFISILNCINSFIKK